MAGQALNTIIIASATIIAALSGSLITYFINTKKNRLELKLKKLDNLSFKRDKLETAKNLMLQEDKTNFDENENPTVIMGTKVIDRAFELKNILESINHYLCEEEITEIQFAISRLSHQVAELKILAHDKKLNPDVILNMKEFQNNNPFQLAVEISSKIEKIISMELNKTLKKIEKTLE